MVIGKLQRWLLCQGTDADGPSCGVVELEPGEYLAQMDRPNQGWICPKCGGRALWHGETIDGRPVDL